MKRPSEQKESLLSNLENDWVAQNPMRMRLLWQTAGASNSRSKATFLGHTEQSCLFASKTGSRCVSLVALRWTSVFSLPSTKITSIYHLAHLWTAPKHIDMFLPCINSNSRRPQRQTKWVQGRFFPLTHIMGKAVSQVMLHAIKFRIYLKWLYFSGTTFTPWKLIILTSCFIFSFHRFGRPKNHILWIPHSLPAPGLFQCHAAFTEAPHWQKEPPQQSEAAHRNLSGEPCNLFKTRHPAKGFKHLNGGLEGFIHAKSTLSNQMWGEQQLVPYRHSSASFRIYFQNSLEHTLLIPFPKLQTWGLSSLYQRNIIMPTPLYTSAVLLSLCSPKAGQFWHQVRLFA